MKGAKKDVIWTTLDRMENGMAAKGLADLRFSTVSEEDLDEILLAAKAENTICSTKTWVAVFLSYLEEESIVIDLKTCQTRELAGVRLYVEVRKNRWLYLPTIVPPRAE